MLLPVTLAWSPDPNPQVEGYQLEINSTPSFPGGRGGVEECVSGLTQPQDTLFSLPSGTHYWRVDSSHGLAGPDTEAVTAWSATRSFTVSSANQVFIESNQQEDGSSVPNYFSGRTAVAATLLFNGNAPIGSVVTLASSSAAASVPASVPAAGQLVTFRVTTRPVTASMRVLIAATWRGSTVSVKMTLQPPPTLLGPIAGSSFTTGQGVNFRWRTPAGLSSELQIAGNPAFTDPIEVFDTDTAEAWTFTSLTSGTLYWRVLGVEVYGNDGPAPTAVTFTVRPPSGNDEGR